MHQAPKTLKVAVRDLFAVHGGAAARSGGTLSPVRLPPCPALLAARRLASSTSSNHRSVSSGVCGWCVWLRQPASHASAQHWLQTGACQAPDANHTRGPPLSDSCAVPTYYAAAGLSAPLPPALLEHCSDAACPAAAAAGSSVFRRLCCPGQVWLCGDAGLVVPAAPPRVRLACRTRSCLLGPGCSPAGACWMTVCKAPLATDGTPPGTGATLSACGGSGPGALHQQLRL